MGLFNLCHSWYLPQHFELWQFPEQYQYTWIWPAEQNMLVELDYKFNGPSPLWMDNLSSMSVAKNPEHYGQMKHLDLWFYWLRDEVGRGTIEPMYMKTEDMPADLLTKSLPKPQVEKLRDIMELVL